MNGNRRTLRAGAAVVAACVLGLTPAAQGAYVPWDPMVGDSWINFTGDPPVVRMYPVNAAPYGVGFDRRKNNGGARGLNALVFEYGGQTVGHLVGTAPSGSFLIRNIGDNRTFQDVLVLVAIDAPSLPPGFAMSMGPSGQTQYAFDPANDFAYYDPAAFSPPYDTGRPSGYYSLTSPAGDPISYAFDDGVVSLLALRGVNLEGTALGANNAVEVSYSFDNLPGTAVFSVYGFDPTYASSGSWIAHTNRALPDGNDPTSQDVSTFEVPPSSGPGGQEVPEPVTLAALAAGLAGLGAYARKRGG